MNDTTGQKQKRADGFLNELEIILEHNINLINRLDTLSMRLNGGRVESNESLSNSMDPKEVSSNFSYEMDAKLRKIRSNQDEMVEILNALESFI